MMVDIPVEYNPKTGGKWRTNHARQAFAEAFQEKFNPPFWFEKIEFNEGKKGGPNSTATIFCKEGKQAFIKVLASKGSIELFWDSYPDAPVVAIAVGPHDSPHIIRDRVFTQIGQNR